jgi:hypothetical protein
MVAVFFADLDTVFVTFFAGAFLAAVFFTVFLGVVFAAFFTGAFFFAAGLLGAAFFAGFLIAIEKIRLSTKAAYK